MNLNSNKKTIIDSLLINNKFFFINISDNHKIFKLSLLFNLYFMRINWLINYLRSSLIY